MSLTIQNQILHQINPQDLDSGSINTQMTNPSTCTPIPEKDNSDDSWSPLNIVQTPNQTPVDATLLSDYIVATPSPGAMIAALCIKEAMQENEASQKEFLAQNDAKIKQIHEQAENIKTGAAWQLALNIVGSAASAALSAVSAAKTLKADSSLTGVAGEQALTPAKNWSIAAKSTESVFGSVGNYLNTRYQAENKEIDATLSQISTNMEQIKAHQQAQKDLVNKALEFMNTMQANMNQTKAKILA